MRRFIHDKIRKREKLFRARETRARKEFDERNAIALSRYLRDIGRLYPKGSKAWTFIGYTQRVNCYVVEVVSTSKVKIRTQEGAELLSRLNALHPGWMDEVGGEIK